MSSSSSSRSCLRDDQEETCLAFLSPIEFPFLFGWAVVSSSSSSGVAERIEEEPEWRWVVQYTVEGEGKGLLLVNTTYFSLVLPLASKVACPKRLSKGIITHRSSRRREGPLFFFSSSSSSSRHQCERGCK